MLIRGVVLTPALAAWLRSAHDDGAAPLEILTAATHLPLVWYDYPEPDDYEVARADGSPLSPTEEREVRALLAAHAAEPLGMPRALRSTPMPSGERLTPEQMASMAAMPPDAVVTSDDTGLEQ